MFDEYEVIRARRQLSEKVPLGAQGTVLFVHKYPHPGYLVEFTDGDAEHLDVLAVVDNDIAKDS